MTDDNRLQQLPRHLREANSFIAHSNQSNTSQSSTVANLHSEKLIEAINDIKVQIQKLKIDTKEN